MATEPVSTNRYTFHTYDDAGSVTKDATRTYTYDGMAMMTAVNSAAADDRFIYTADDERIAIVRRVDVSGTARNRTTWTLRGTNNQLLRTFTDDSTSGTRVWTWTEDEIWRGTQLMASESESGRKHYALDHLGSPRFVSDANGNRLGEQNFTPFGAGGTSDGGRIQFTGHEADSPSMSYMHARYYESGLGRFLSVDRVNGMPTRPQTWNRYGYSLNNPVNRVDPDGNCSVPAGLQAGQVGICIESFIAAKWIGGIGRGDDRTFAANNPKLSNRMQAQIIVDPQSGRIVMTKTAGVSGVISKNWGGRGTNTATISNVSMSAGQVNFSVSGTGTNWWAWAPGAPNRAIMWNINIDVSRKGDGGVGIAGASRISGFPSTAMYIYKVSANGEVISDMIFEHNEQTPTWLGKLNWTVEPVPPTFMARPSSASAPNDGGSSLFCVNGHCQ